MYNVAASLYVAAVLLLLSLVAVQVFMVPCGYITGSGYAGVAALDVYYHQWWLCQCCGTVYVLRHHVCVPVLCMCASAMYVCRRHVLSWCGSKTFRRHSKYPLTQTIILKNKT